MTDREKHISVLQNIDRAYRTFTQEEYRALEYAIASLKTDLKYDLMYEGEEAYTKADLVAMLTELHIRMEEIGDDLDPTEDWDYGYKSGVEDMIQLLDERIDKLKGESDAQEQKKE